MAYTITTEAEILQKAGAGKAAGFTTTMMENAEDRAIALMSVMTRYNWADNVPTNEGIKELLSDIISSLVAIEAISYDMSGYTTRTEAEDMINVLRDGMLRNMAILRDQKSVKFIQDNAT